MAYYFELLEADDQHAVVVCTDTETGHVVLGFDGTRPSS